MSIFVTNHKVVNGPFGVLRALPLTMELQTWC
jgi:hypothetical protein